jgi:phosphatidylinositol glycan class M
MDAVVRFICQRRPGQLLAMALALRLVMIGYSVFHDHVFAVKYTDIDYDVVTDGARAMWRDFPSSHASPFERVTYRYTPLLAVVMLPNVFAFYAFGKLLLGFCDVMAGWYAFDCFERGGSETTATQRAGRSALSSEPSWRNPKFLVSAFLLFNPVVVNVSTRGNSDMLITFLVLAALSAFGRRRYAIAGLFIGVAVHVKIYPIVYVPCFVFALLHRLASKASSGAAVPSARALIRTAKSAEFIGSVVTAAVGVVIAAGAPTLLCIVWYGQQYLDEALLYHIGRVDHRHNFSPYWYPMYLGMAARDVPGLLGEGVAPTGAWLKTGLIAFVPQLGAMLAAAWVLRRNATHAVTVVTMIFVAFNKVCTVQYFVWYLPLLPFVFAAPRAELPKLRAAAHGTSRGGIVGAFVLAAVWFGALVTWMVWSVKVEFNGEPAWVGLWLASVFFFVMQVLVTRAVAAAAVASQKAEYGL